MDKSHQNYSQHFDMVELKTAGNLVTITRESQESRVNPE